MRRLFSLTTLFYCVIVCTISVIIIPTSVLAYPVIVQVEEQAERCLRLNIPQDDDSHLVFLVLPGPEVMGEDNHDTVEAWYIDQVYKMTKLKSQHEVLPKKLPDSDVPTPVSTVKSDFIKAEGGESSPLRVIISDKPIETSKQGQNTYKPRFFNPLVINYVRKLTRGRQRGWEDAQLEGYGICFVNDHTEHSVQVIFDSILVSEDVQDDDTLTKETLDKDRHLTPLEESLEQSIAAAQTVLREMKFLELREARMRQTAESINARVRWFSYLSVGVLLSVTYVQVTYLKRYFRKKKLM